MSFCSFGYHWETSTTSTASTHGNNMQVNGEGGSHRHKCSNEYMLSVDFAPRFTVCLKTHRGNLVDRSQATEERVRKAIKHTEGE